MTPETLLETSLSVGYGALCGFIWGIWPQREQRRLKPEVPDSPDKGETPRDKKRRRWTAGPGSWSWVYAWVFSWLSFIPVYLLVFFWGAQLAKAVDLVSLAGVLRRLSTTAGRPEEEFGFVALTLTLYHFFYSLLPAMLAFEGGERLRKRRDRRAERQGGLLLSDFAADQSVKLHQQQATSDEPRT